VSAVRLESLASPNSSVTLHDRTPKGTDGIQGLKGSSAADVRTLGWNRDPAAERKSACRVHRQSTNLYSGESRETAMSRNSA